MLENLWLTGVLVAFSVFGVKVALGLGSQLYNQTVSRKRKTIFFAGSLSAYLILFVGIYFIITCFNLINYLDQFMEVLRYGMVLHLVIAIGLLVWGVKLLMQKKEESQNDSCKACIFLIMPCPVCSVSIFLNLTFAYSFSTMSAWSTTLVMFGIFSFVIFITVAIMWPFRNKIGSGAAFLGTSMSLVSLYFFITLIIAQIYQKIKDVYAMSNTNAPVSESNSSYTVIFIGFIILLMVFGYIRNRYIIKGITK